MEGSSSKRNDFKEKVNHFGGTSNKIKRNLNNGGHVYPRIIYCLHFAV